MNTRTSAAAVLFALAGVLATPPAALAGPGSEAGGWTEGVTLFGTLGADIAVDGDTAIFGEPGYTDSAGLERVGAVHVYIRDPGGGWSLLQTLTLFTDWVTDDAFGTAVTVSGDHLIASAPGRGEGIVVAFERSAMGFWIRAATMTADAGAGGGAFGVGGFGRHIDYDGDTLAVASTEEGDGIVYIYARELLGSKWVREDKVTGSAVDSASLFGTSVAVSGTRVAVGAQGDDGSNDDTTAAGAVYVFTRDTSSISWSETALVRPTTTHLNQRFGASVDIDGDRLFVGATGDAGSVSDGGAAYLMVPTPSQPSGWDHTARLEPSGGEMNTSYGRSVRIKGDRMMVSSAIGNPLFGAAVWVYDVPAGGGAPTETGRLFRSQTAPDTWGERFDFDGDHAAAGDGGQVEGVTFYSNVPDPCADAPCQNGGQCVPDGAGGGDCDCSFVSYWGAQCENPVRCSSCLTGDATPDDPLYATQGLAALGLAAARAEGDGAGARVAIIGHGFDHAHIDGPEHLRTDLGFDFLDVDADASDLTGPGTALVGVIAAKTNNAEGIASLAPNAEIVPMRVVDGATGLGPPAALASAIQFARETANILFITARMPGGDDPDVRAQIEAAYDDDVLIIAPAGGYPAAYPQVISVGALGAGDVADATGGYLPPYDVLAPDAGITSLLAGGGYGATDNVGVAAALVAGAAALNWSARDFPSASSISRNLTASARDLNVSGWDPDTGHGAFRLDIATSMTIGCANCIAGTSSCLSENTCQNGGSCRRTGDTTYQCDCTPGFGGPGCQQPVPSPCDPNPCMNGAQCNDSGDFISCLCTAGYSGPLCGDSACQPNPCANDGVCTSTGPSSHFCICQPGYSGTDCMQNNDDPCDPDPCVNGTCSGDVASGPVCGCDDGWEGDTCATDIDECATNNGGCSHTCTDSDGSFACSCPDGYALNADGLTCDDVNECDDANGGCDQTCTNSPAGSFTCSCGAGYTLNANGLACDDINECVPSNAGCQQACQNTDGSFVCQCITGYTLNADGVTCDDVNECLTNNGGCDQGCANSVGGFTCSCGSGYVLDSDGTTCLNVDDCTADACLNGTTCVDGLNSYTCDCGADFKGDACYLAVGCGDCGDTQQVPSDPRYGDQWAMARIGAPWAWDVTLGSPAVQVAVISTGVDLLHPDAPTRFQTSVSFDLATGGDLRDVSGFGTYLSGLLAAPHDNGAGIAGVAPNVEVSALKVTGPNGTATATLLAQGITTAVATGADILLVGVITQQDFPAVAAAVASANDAGRLVIAPAGGFPGDYPGVLAVGAIDDSGVISSVFASPDVVAPDGGVLSTLPGGAYGSLPAGAPTALVGGVAALVWSELGATTGDAVRDILLRSAEDVGAPGWDPLAGYGVVRADSAVAHAAGCVDCAWTPDPCGADPCFNDGACTRTTEDAFECACAVGFEGPLCKQQADACTPNPCQNDGACSVVGSSIQCDCAAGFSGPVCEYAVGACTEAAPTPGCDDPAVQSCVCDLAPQCCTVKWASLCVAVAAAECSAVSGPPAVDDPVRACACAQKGACCDGWDPICDEIAADRCRGRGDCLSAHRAPGCDDPEIAGCVCAKNPLCCTFGWGSSCAKIAALECRDDPAPPTDEGPQAGPCMQPHDGVGCNDGDVEACVCGLLPHCCVLGWDLYCAKQADSYCVAPDDPPPGDPPDGGSDDEEDVPDPPQGDIPPDPLPDTGPAKRKGRCCDVKRDATGCDEPVTEACTCIYEPECCTLAWDERCPVIAQAACNAFCENEPPVVVLPPNGDGPDPYVPPDIEPTDPCLGVVMAMDTEACFSIAFHEEIEAARLNVELNGQVTLCMEERTERCSALMQAELDQRFNDAREQGSLSTNLVIRPFTDPADFPDSRVVAVVDPNSEGDPPFGAFIDLFPVFTADKDVNSCEEYAFQAFYDYQQWLRYPNSRYNHAYSRGILEGGIGRRGLRVETPRSGLRKTIRTLTEHADGADYAIPGWTSPELRGEFAAPKNGFTITDQRLAAGIRRRDALLEEKATATQSYYPERATHPWHWHRDMGDRLFAQDGWTVEDLYYFDSVEREFQRLETERNQNENRIQVLPSGDPQRAALIARREALDDQLVELLRFADGLGCLVIDDVSPCDWAISDFIEEVTSFYEGHYLFQFRRCLQFTGNDFSDLTWLKPDHNGDQLTTDPRDPTESDIAFIEYLRDLEASLAFVIQNFVPNQDDLKLADGDIDDLTFGNSSFGVSFGWDHSWRMQRPTLNLETQVCSFDAETHADVHITGALFGETSTLYGATLDADIKSRIGHGSLTILDDLIWQRGSATGNGQDALPLNIVVAPHNDGDARVEERYFEYDEWIYPFWVPIHVYAGITGQLGVDVDVNVRHTGFTHDAGVFTCNDDVNLAIAGRMRPYAGVIATASASVGVPGFEAGIGGQLTLIEGALPYSVNLQMRQRPGAPSVSLSTLQLAADANLSKQLTVMAGRLYAYLEYVCSWDFDTCTTRRNLWSDPGWIRSEVVFDHSARFDVGQIAAVCDAIATIPNDVLSCD